jgi:DNA repair exonuclease SbcCD nuclease subunit
VKISVLADCHLGSGHNTEREEDAFDNFREALEKSADCDVILIAGDLFDTRSPRTTVWAKAISLLNIPMMRRSGVSLIATDKQLNHVHSKTIETTPVVCLHGNHDRRMRDEINAVQALDAAGMLIHLHRQHMVFEKDGVRVAVHGMSSVPERYAGQYLKEWNPRPIQDSFNILMIHQNVAPYVYSPLEPPSIGLEDLPRGFDMILDGHIHTKVIDKSGDSLFMILGSTVITQFDKREAGSIKGFHKITFENGRKPEIEFVPLESNRRFFYYEISAENVEMMRNEMDAVLSEITSSRLQKKPVVKFKIYGSDTKPVDQDIAMLQKKYGEKVLLSFVKNLKQEEQSSSASTFDLGSRLSIEEMGMKLMKQNLGRELSFDATEMFQMLGDGDVEKALAVLTNDQKLIYESMRK